MRKQCVIPSILFLRLFSAVEYLTTMRVLGTGFVDDHKISSNKSLHCGIMTHATLQFWKFAKNKYFMFYNFYYILIYSNIEASTLLVFKQNMKYSTMLDIYFKRNKTFHNKLNP